MKQNNKILIDFIRFQLQLRMNYPIAHELHPDYLTLDEAFDELWYGFRRYCIRHDIFSAPKLTDIYQRGWMSVQDANLFCNYCIKGWKIA